MKRNIIILHTDQQRYDSLGCHGNTQAITPNIDALAQDGTHCTRHIAANPTCMPSRASLLTGLYPPGHGVTSNGIPLWRRTPSRLEDSDRFSKLLFGQPVADKIPTMADMLHEQGYHTAMFGKLHLEPAMADAEHGFFESYEGWEQATQAEKTGDFYGFQEYKLVLGHGESVVRYDHGHYGRWIQENHPEIANLARKNEGTNTKSPGEREDIYLSKIPSHLHNTMWIANQAAEYLERAQTGEPFFMFVGFPDPHHPFTPPEDIFAPFAAIDPPEFSSRQMIKGEKSAWSRQAMENNYALQTDCDQAWRHTMAAVHLIDTAVGRIIDTLKKNKMYDDTIIVFTSDHGDFLGDFQTLSKADVAFHNLVHVPFILKGPRGVQLPEVIETPMSNVDVLPTILPLAGVETVYPLQGIDILSERSAGNTPMVTCFRAILGARNISLYDKTYRYTYFLDTGEEELYDHLDDPREYNNLVQDTDHDVHDLCKMFKERLFQKHIECDWGTFQHYSLW